jgi:hypothetical protein
MSRQYFQECLAWATASGTAVGNTVTETIVFPNIVIPANYFQSGRTLRLRAFGQIGNVVTAVPTVTFRVRWGGVAGTVLCSSGAVGCSATAFTGAIWDLEVMLTNRVDGSAGQIFAMGSMNIGNDAVPQARGMGSAGALVPAVVTALDLTADTALSLTATWSAANAANTLTGHNFYVEALN